MERSPDQRIARALADLRQETPQPLRTREPASLAQRMQSYATPGVSISVVQDCQVVAEMGFGVLRAGTDDAVNPTTLFQAGSISKPVLAMAVMRLVSSGVLDLDADVNDTLTSCGFPTAADGRRGSRCGSC